MYTNMYAFSILFDGSYIVVKRDLLARVSQSTIYLPPAIALHHIFVILDDKKSTASSLKIPLIMELYRCKGELACKSEPKHDISPTSYGSRHIFVIKDDKKSTASRRALLVGVIGLEPMTLCL